MANNYFEFKQFKVQQELAAMKVGTDGVLLGAWACFDNSNAILDIGTGTGLIALMAAQRNKKARIVGIDIDADAYLQAKTNVSNSDWGDRITIINSSLQQYAKVNHQGFDHLVCNPPFFNNSFKSQHKSRTLARHTDALPYAELIENASKLISKAGCFSVILPYAEMDNFCQLAVNSGFYSRRILYVKPTPAKTFVRVLIEFVKENNAQVIKTEMIIEDKGRHGYSDDYIAMTKEFYVKI